MINYLIALTALWFLSLLLFELGFKQLPFHRANRIYLLLSLILGLVLPSLELNFNRNFSDSSINQTIIFAQTIKTKTTIAQQIPQKKIDYTNIIIITYIIGIIFSIGYYFVHILSLLRVFKHGLKEQHNTYTIIYSKNIKQPCSFFSYVFMPIEIHYSNNEKLMILRHEQQHIKLLHSFDIVVLMFVKITFWFHPLVYVFWNRLRLIHEFEADYIEKANANEYGHFLIEQTMLSTGNPITNNAFHSPLKNRIMMLVQNSKATYWRYGIALLLMPFFVLSSLKAVSQGKRKQLKEKMVYSTKKVIWSKQTLDTFTVEDPATGGLSQKLVYSPKLPISIGNQKVIQIQDLSQAPKLSNGEIEPAVKIFNELQSLLNQLSDGFYQIPIENTIVDEKGSIVYYETKGIQPSFFTPIVNDDGEEKSISINVVLDNIQENQTKGTIEKPKEDFISKDLKKEIDSRLFEILEQEFKFTPAKVGKRNVTTVLIDELDLVMNRIIEVKNHKATLSVKRRGEIKL